MALKMHPKKYTLKDIFHLCISFKTYYQYKSDNFSSIKGLIKSNKVGIDK